MARPVDEGLIEIDGAPFYAIPAVDRMAPFLMSVVSDGDRWMFVSSTGALTAGRVDVNGALFPYETDDRLHLAAGSTGPVSRFRVTSPAGESLWRPFAGEAAPDVARSIAKSVAGESVVFEERHARLGLTFRYQWSSAERFGFVRSASLVNDTADDVEVEVLDGLVNLLPYGLEPTVYQRLSNLSNAYKRSELTDAATRLAVYSLESPVSDRAEAEEVLRATVTWSVGLDDAQVTLDPGAVRSFDLGAPARAETKVTGRPGAYLLRGAATVHGGGEVAWRIVADVGHDQSDVVSLRRTLRDAADIDAELGGAVRDTRERLVGIMAPADALQRTGDPIACAHHFANVTYNVMRGGVPLAGYRIDTADFASFVAGRNRHVAERHDAWLAALPRAVDRRDLLERIGATGDVHLLRLGREYLPFSFSRRHGDPSRPWNKFSIRVRDEDGNPVIYYEGNWRDVFQNWEALCASFPEYLPGVVSVFLNASTADGFNPYRITRDGIDWEIPDPDDPWANIGYWGDHQLIYLLRLLEATERYFPGEIAGHLLERCFAYADVPYRLAPYDELVRDPKSTIRFDERAHARATELVAAVGGDGTLLRDGDGGIHLVTMLEKLLVTALAKISNLVPGGGIWMNTQRPEWNDANNALVGYGLSMVTLCHLRQFLHHLRGLVAATVETETAVSAEVADWLHAVTDVLRDAPAHPNGDADRHRKHLMDRLGAAFSGYRSQVYEHGLSAPVGVSPDAIVEVCETTIAHLDVSIRAARREDGLYHSYSLVRFSSDGTSAAVEHLPEMLEGQVAVIGAGVLSAAEQADVIDALFASSMYRADQQTFMLYPVRHLPGFVDKNVVPADEVEGNPLLRGLLAAGDSTIVRVDADGVHRFDADLVDEAALDAALDRLGADGAWRELVTAHRQATLDAYERVFGHRSLMGRSGSMYAYEGIGSIYWHMVAKLLVATQEAAVAAVASGASRATAERLVAAYRRVSAGLGCHKTAAEFGAVPIDPYSHTPGHAGAQQPGMTGLVKEELLVRPLELGVRIAGGAVVFDPLLVGRDELLTEAATWSVITLAGERTDIVLAAGTLGFTLCQVPIVVGAGEPRVEVHFADGRVERVDGLRLTPEVSAAVFGRTGDVARIDATLPLAG